MSGKCTKHDDTHINGKRWGPTQELKPICSPWHCQKLNLFSKLCTCGTGHIQNWPF